MKTRNLKIALPLVVSALCVPFITGCYSIAKTTTFRLDGSVESVTESKEPLSGQIISSTKNKTVYKWTKGWGADLELGNISADNPTGGFKMKAFNLDEGLLTLHKDQQNLDKVAEIIRACNSSSLSISPSGVTGKSGSVSAQDSAVSKSTEVTAQDSSVTTETEKK
jgi:hypothetical protein